MDQDQSGDAISIDNDGPHAHKASEETILTAYHFDDQSGGDTYTLEIEPPTSSALTRPHTQLSSGIRKEKVYTDGTIKYGCFTTTGEP